MMPADVDRYLITSGVLLLSAAALLGFAQARATPGSDAHTRWRVAHAGGTAGAVQLIALGAALSKLSVRSDGPTLTVLLGITLGTWAFFVGPLLRALGAERSSRMVNLCGACVAGPAYLALPWLLLR